MRIMTEFQLHERLARDLIFINDLKLSRLMVLPDKENPWCVLIPRRQGLTELHHLNTQDQSQILHEINFVSQIFEKAFAPDKINVASLGNMVNQLHFHVIARYRDDRAWPGAIWGTQPLQDRKFDVKDVMLASVT